MKKLCLSLLLFSPFLYAMDDPVEVTLANNQKAVLTRRQLKRLSLSSATLKNAAHDLNDNEQLPDYFPYIEDSEALSRISTLLNDDGTPKGERCLSQTKGDWCTIAPALESLDIPCLNPYLLTTLENSYSSPIFGKALLHGFARSLSYKTLPSTFKDELARRINQKNVNALSAYYEAQTISVAHDGYDGDIRATALSDDGTHVSASIDYTLKLWELKTASFKRLIDRNNLISAVAIMPDNKTIVFGGIDNKLKFWNFLINSLHQIPNVPCTTTMAISPLEKNLVTGSSDGSVRIWNSNTRSLLQKLKVNEDLEAHEGEVTGIAISLDEDTIVSSSNDRTIKVWDPYTGSLQRTLEDHEEGAVSTVAITPNGQTLVSGSHDGELKFWNLKDGSLLHRLEAHKDSVTGIAISLDEDTIVSSSSDCTIKIWNLATRSPLQTLESHGDCIKALAISRNGQTLVSASVNGILKIWKSDLSLELKKELVQRPLEQALMIQALRTRSNP